jgi:HSP20 family molecular chaperone IbpA
MECSDTEMTVETGTVRPDVFSYISDDEKSLMIEVTLPGVHKESIDLSMRRDGFRLLALRDDTSFETSATFCCPVDVENVKAHYDNGLLKIVAPYEDPMKDARKVAIR